MKKVGLIGCGFMGGCHANCYTSLTDKVKVVAVADVRADFAKEIADKFGAEIYSDAAQLIEKADVDYVDICLPTHLHEKYAVMAMKKGLDVFCEKPVCRTKEEAENLLKVQKETGRTVQVGQVIRFWNEYVYLKNVKEAGTYGKVVGANFRRVSPRPAWAWENWLHTASQSGGMALDFHIHDIDFVRYLLGEPKKITASGVPEEGGLSDYIHTTYHYDDMVATAEGCWNYPKDFPFSMSFTVKFEKATIELDTKGAFTVYPVDGEKFSPDLGEISVDPSAKGNISSLGGYHTELAYFLDMLDNPEMKNIASLEEGTRSVVLALEGIEKAFN